MYLGERMYGLLMRVGCRILSSPIIHHLRRKLALGAKGISCPSAIVVPIPQNNHLVPFHPRAGQSSKRENRRREDFGIFIKF